MTVRHYEGATVSTGGMRLRTDDTVLPESFRWPHAKSLQHPHYATVAPSFVRLDTRDPEEVLDGDYYYVDCLFSGHFGHLTTEVLCRLWGWDRARRDIPGIKMLFHTHPAGGRTARSSVGSSPRTASPARRLVSSDRPVLLRSVVGASPMWHNKAPFYVHPDIRETWARLTTGLTADLDPSPHERIFVSRGPALSRRRGCRNQQDVERFFADRDYHVFYPEELPLAEQARLFAGARVVAGFGGSAMFNLMHCQRLEAAVVISHHAYVARNEHLFTSVLGGQLHYFWQTSDVPPPEVRPQQGLQRFVLRLRLRGVRRRPRAGTCRAVTRGPWTRGSRVSVPFVPSRPAYHPSHDLHGALADRPAGERRRAPRRVDERPRPRRRSGARSPDCLDGRRLDHRRRAPGRPEHRVVPGTAPQPWAEKFDAVGTPGQCLVVVGCLNKSAMLETVASVLGAAQPGDVLVLEAGTNDLGKATDAQLKRGYRAVVRGGAARGVEVVVGTIPPRGAGQGLADRPHRASTHPDQLLAADSGMGNRGLRRQVGTAHRSRTGPAVRLRRWAPSQRQGGSRPGPPRGEVARPALSRPGAAQPRRSVDRVAR